MPSKVVLCCLGLIFTNVKTWKQAKIWNIWSSLILMFLEADRVSRVSSRNRPNIIGNDKRRISFLDEATTLGPYVRMLSFSSSPDVAGSYSLTMLLNKS
jgi:hypothetical protein